MRNVNSKSVIVLVIVVLVATMGAFTFKLGKDTVNKSKAQKSDLTQIMDEMK